MRTVLSSRSRRVRRGVAAAVATTVALPLSLTGIFSAAAAEDEPGPVEVAPAAEAIDEFDVLVFSKTAGFRHGSIPTGVAAIEQLGQDNGFTVTATEDAGAFTEENLEQYEAVVFLSTTGDVLDDTQQAVFEGYIEDGGGYAGIHAASDTEYDWPWYGELVGAYFAGHPAQQDATIKVEDHAHPSTEHLPERWDRFDEWYNFRSDPRDEVHVLASLDESTYNAGGTAMGAEHPIAWCHNFEGGRSWYTGGGHTDASFSEPDFLEHLLGGIRTAAGVVDNDCNASQTESYEQVTLDDETQNPMVLDVAPNGDVFYAERDGRVQVIGAESGITTTALELSVTQGNEDGLLGLVLDPDFESNGWVYVYWSPTDVDEDGPHNRISRFTYDPDTGSIDPGSQVKVLVVETQRDTCCHAGGDMVFDDAGNLILATGDNTNPFQSNGYTPIDEREGRENFDAQGTSGNTNDLRGKIVRITPQEDGTYTVPEGNLFEPGTDLTRPEIYAMGFRNPFRIDLDAENGNILVGDYGPDNRNANPDRGPAGTVEWNVVAEPGNYGWPYCTGDLDAYVDYDFATGQSGEPFDCAAPVNDSPNNTGLTELPPIIGAEIPYDKDGSEVSPEIGGGGAPMGGPTYSYDPDLDSDYKWPEYWDGKAFFGEWNQGNMYSIQLAGETREDVVDVNRILPGIFDSSAGFNRPMDFEFGPDGVLYMVDWGAGFGGNNDTSGIFKVNYVQGDPAPIARAEADVTSGAAPLTVQFSSEGSRHPGGEPITRQWTFGDGSAPSTEADPTHTYTENGSYTAQLTVTAANEKTSTANVTVVVGNEAPTVSITFPENGGFFEFGDQVAYEVEVTDPDGEVDCSEVNLYTSLGHDTHAHPFEELTGCSGMLQTARDEGHGISENIFWVIEASYTDDGGDAGVPLGGNDLQVLQPKALQAEFFTSTGRLDGSTSSGSAGVQTEETEDEAGGGLNVGWTEADDWWAFEPVSLNNVEAIALRASTPASSSRVSVRWDAPDGPEIALITVPGTGGWQNWITTDPVELVDPPSGSGTLYFVSLDGRVNVNWAEFDGRGVTDNVRPDVTLEADPVAGDAPLTVTATATATDPDGDSETLTYAWDAGLGDGFVEGTSSFEHTYTEPGTYRVQVRVTDAGGAYATEYVEVEVSEVVVPPAQCFSGRSDDFLGDELDEDRWTTVVRRDQNLAVSDGNLVIPATKTDIYGGSADDVSNIVLQDLPEGDFTVTTKVDLAARVNYQQAGLVLYADDANYVKMAVQGRGSSPDADSRIFQLATEVDGDPSEINTGIGADFGDTVYLRLTRTGESLVGSYSADGVTFTDMPESTTTADIVDPKIGLTAFANVNSPADVIDARFDWFSVTPDDTAVAPGPDDEFEGDQLDGCRWAVVREDPTGYRVGDGSLEIDTTATDIYGADNTGTPNIVVQDQPDGDWTVETKVDVSDLDQRWQQAGLIAYVDDDNYVKFDYLAKNQPGATTAANLEVRSEENASAGGPTVSDVTGDVWHLRLAKAGTTFSASYSTDGETWEEFPESVTNESLGDAKVGLFTLGGVQQSSSTAAFDYFHVVGDDVEPLEVTGSLDPAAPDGEDGTYTGPVTVSIETTGGPEDVLVYREYNLDGEGWAEYTAPVEISEPGEHTVQVRASAGDDNVTGEELTFTIAEPAELEATPAVTVNQSSCTVVDGEFDQVNGSVVGAEMDGVARYVVKDADDSSRYVRAGDMSPGEYLVRAWPAEGYTLVPGDGWEEIFKGRLETSVTIDEFDCPTATPVVSVTQPTCEVDADGENVRTGGSLTGEAVEGVKGYVVHNWVDGDLNDGKPSDLGDLAPGQYHVIATPDADHLLEVDGEWAMSPSGKATLVVTIDGYGCDRVPAVDLVQPTCSDGGATTGSLSPVDVTGVKGYVVHNWVDGHAQGKPSDLAELEPGQYRVIASPEPKTELEVEGEWELSPSGKAKVILTVEEVACG
ncbi:ThuA domain-containing protein [Isoptericola halotolerans]|uniref:ThuA domain-containing protein n=1 Tax=Isoptericola halotolerans TaxID=300560 RepID=UPI00388CF576